MRCDHGMLALAGWMHRDSAQRRRRDRGRKKAGGTTQRMRGNGQERRRGHYTRRERGNARRGREEMTWPHASFSNRFRIALCSGALVAQAPSSVTSSSAAPTGLLHSLRTVPSLSRLAFWGTEDRKMVKNGEKCMSKRSDARGRVCRRTVGVRGRLHCVVQCSEIDQEDGGEGG